MFQGMQKDIFGECLTVITGTTSSTVDSSVSESLPNGWTADNCFIIGFSVKTNTIWRSFGVYTGQIGVDVFLSSGTLYATTRSSSCAGKDFKVLVYKYE